jgi:hypothetical protein
MFVLIIVTIYSGEAISFFSVLDQKAMSASEVDIIHIQIVQMHNLYLYSSMSNTFLVLSNMSTLYRSFLYCFRLHIL